MTAKQPLISIIIPIYNVEKYLHECLESILKQTYTNIEIIAVNDGSPDGCGEIIEHYVASDNRVIHLKQDNKGLPLARMNGVKLSKADYIMFVDGDDFISEDCVEKLLSAIRKKNADISYCSYYNYYGTSKKRFAFDLPHLYTETGSEHVVNNRLSSIWGRIIRKEYFVDTEPQKMNMGEDIFYLVQILVKCERVTYSDNTLYFYRDNESSIVRSSDAIKQEIEHKLLLVDFLVDNKYPKEVIKGIMIPIIYIVKKYCNSYNDPLISSMKKKVKKLTSATIKYYPNLFKGEYKDKNIKLIIIFYIIHYFPNMVSLIHRFIKLNKK